ncbi:MAG TPA: hypothetical protein V6C81_01630 [Planktothrix sp.]|jgi:hypothetical protein
MNGELEDKRIEFRVPVSPTPGFISQVRFYACALRRLGGIYERALISIIVGDHCDVEELRKQNEWSAGQNLRWIAVPDDIFDKYGVWGTANWRLCMGAEGSDIIVLSDADSVIVGDISPALQLVNSSDAAIAGHMANAPPVVQSSPIKDLRNGNHKKFWPALYKAFGIPWGGDLHRYSLDKGRDFPEAPPYFNGGFVVFNRAALAHYQRETIWFEDAIKQFADTYYRPQIGITIIAAKNRIKAHSLPAQYNATNDLLHYQLHKLTPDQLKVIHYLRCDEINRSEIFLPEHLESFLARELKNPVNQVVQSLALQLKNSLSQNCFSDSVQISVPIA